jgi:hypothetical protein
MCLLLTLGRLSEGIQEFDDQVSRMKLKKFYFNSSL